MSLDPNTHTREDFTLSLTQRPLPDNAKPEWKSTAEKLRNLLSKLAFHKAMESNIHQTYMTPAASKNKVYFMWDFVGRTLGTLYAVPSDLPRNMSAREKEAWKDVEGRSLMAAQLILDAQPGVLDMMTETTYPDQASKHPEFGEEILAAAREIS